MCTDGDSLLRLSLAASPESVSAARRAVSDFGARVGAPPEVVDRVALSVSEAVTNALVHGYRYAVRPESERIELEARREEEALVVVVRDFGCGMAQRLDSDGRGLGLTLIAASASAMQIETAPEGGRTEVAMELLLADPRVAV
jgi:anti-sigma regulatory factor (Ser/Thr protein kinase)